MKSNDLWNVKSESPGSMPGIVDKQPRCVVGIIDFNIERWNGILEHLSYSACSGLSLIYCPFRKTVWPKHHRLVCEENSHWYLSTWHP